MKHERLQTLHKLLTPASGTTEYIDYLEKENILEVQFKGGRTYQYSNVPLQVWEEYQNVVLTGGSSGTFVNLNIKPHYPFWEVY